MGRRLTNFGTAWCRLFQIGALFFGFISLSCGILLAVSYFIAQVHNEPGWYTLTLGASLILGFKSIIAMAVCSLLGSIGRSCFVVSNK